jgi:hypothetical protein
MSARERYFGMEPLWFWSVDEAVTDRWLTHPFETREDWRQVDTVEVFHPTLDAFLRWPIAILDKERLKERERAFERLLDHLVERFEIDDRVTLKQYIELAARTYNVAPDKLPKDDSELFPNLARKVAALLLRNITAIERIVTNFDQQQLHGFAPEHCKAVYDQGEVDALMEQIRQVPPALLKLAHILSQQRGKRGASPNAGLHGAVAVLKEYWVHKLGRKLKARPWKGDANRFVKIVFKKVIDPAAVESASNAMRGRVKSSGKNTL